MNAYVPSSPPKPKADRLLRVKEPVPAENIQDEQHAHDQQKDRKNHGAENPENERKHTSVPLHRSLHRSDLPDLLVLTTSQAATPSIEIFEALGVELVKDAAHGLGCELGLVLGLVLGLLIGDGRGLVVVAVAAWATTATTIGRAPAAAFATATTSSSSAIAEKHLDLAEKKKTKKGGRVC